MGAGGGGGFYPPPSRYPPPPGPPANYRFQPSVPEEELVAAEAANGDAAKKMPNYRLIGRNIFDPGAKQQFFKVKKKTNTYYSRFIKQHPTSNLPLAFQKSVSLAEDKAMEEAEKGDKKKKKRIFGADDALSSDEEISDSDAEKKLRKKKKKKKKIKSGDESSKTSSSSESGAEDMAYMEMATKRPKSSKGGDDDSDASMMDLSEKLKPIGEYMKNREQMLREMLRCIRGAKLQSMLPEILKNKPFELIREKCMEELEVMSKKRIMYLLQGKDMTSSSGTDESSSEEDESHAANKSNASSLSETPISKKEDEKKPKAVQSASKFKPIGAEASENQPIKVTQMTKSGIAAKPITLLKSEEKHSLRSDDTEEYENTSQEAFSEAGLVEGDTTKPPSGIEAAGFRKFVKKSINIRLKHTDSASNFFADDDGKAKGVEGETRHQSATAINQDYRKYVSKLPKRGTLGDLMRSTASMEEMAPQMATQHLSPYTLMSSQSTASSVVAVAKESQVKVEPESYGYNYGDDDLSNLDSDLEKENASDAISSYHSSEEEERRRKRRSRHRRSGSSDERLKKRRRRSVSGETASESGEDALSSGEERKRAKRRHRKEKERRKEKEKARKKRRRETESEPPEDENELDAIKTILKNILEMKIVEEENGDPEIWHILKSLLNTINEKELSLEDLDDIKETLSGLFEDGTEEKVVVQSDVDGDDEKRKRRKRKKKSSDERHSDGKKRRYSRKEPSEEEGEISDGGDDDQKRKQQSDASDRSLNGEGEEMEAGEIDDLYDDDEQILNAHQ